MPHSIRESRFSIQLKDITTIPIRKKYLAVLSKNDAKRL
jgi:hypothetical protein